MKKYFFFLLLNLLSNFIFAQQEIEIVGIKYRTTTKNDYDIYNSKNNKLDAFVNYGHDLGKKTKLFYHLSYHNINLNSTIVPESILHATFNYPSIPNFSFINIASGMTNMFKNQWSLTNIASFTFSDDFNNEILKPHNYFRSFSYLKKKKSDNFSYGFGVYLSKLNTDWRILPIISLNLKNDKRGLKLFLPRELKFWNNLNSKSYIEFKTIINSNYIKYDKESLDVELLSINSELTYNYIYKKKFKLKTGIGLPYVQYDYINDFKTTQKEQFNYSFVLGLSYVVYKNN
jgi:hypothetical protein